MKIIGISGANGSGKDTLGEILAKDFGWYFVSVSGLLRAEAQRRGLAVERENMRLISAEWRRQHGLGVLMDKAVEEYQKQARSFNGLVISNLRNPGEADKIHQLGGAVIWVDADPKIRYQRVESRRRGPEDHKTFEQFLKEEQDEMHSHGGDEASLDMAGVKAKADITILNNEDIESFKQLAARSLKDYL